MNKHDYANKIKHIKLNIADNNQNFRHVI